MSSAGSGSGGLRRLLWTASRVSEYVLVPGAVMVAYVTLRHKRGPPSEVGAPASVDAGVAGSGGRPGPGSENSGGGGGGSGGG